MLTMLISLMVSVSANVQIQVKKVSIDKVSYVMGTDVITGKVVIKPKMEASFEDPDNWASAPNPADIHPPDFYEIQLRNVTLNKTFSYRANAGSTAFTNKKIAMDNVTALATGSLYELKVLPNHYHDTPSGEVLAPVSGVPPVAYGITDLNVEFEEKEDSIKIIWDDIGISDFTYKIVYALGDYSNKSKQELLNNKEGEINGLTSNSNDVTAYYDTVQKRNKLSYTIANNIYPGQIYSIIVEPTVEYYNGLPVTRNRNNPLISTASTNIRLSYVEIGDLLRLQWKIPASFKVGGGADTYELVETKLVRINDGQEQNIAILNGLAGAIGHYTINSPNVETSYQIKLKYKAVGDATKPAITPVSNILTYAPSEVQITPTKPVVPKLLTKQILSNLRATHTVEQVRDILADTYLVPGNTYLENLDDLFEAKVTYHLNESMTGVNFVWSSFRRKDTNLASTTYNKYITDLNVYYDVQVTTTYDALNYAIPVIADKRYNPTETDQFIRSSDGSIVGFKAELFKYYDPVSGTLKNLKPNQLYFIKVVCKKKVGNEVYLSDPTITSIYYTDNQDIYAPPVITQLPLRVLPEYSKKTSQGIGWLESWWEVIELNPAAGSNLNRWSTEVWVGSGGQIATEELPDYQYFPVYKGPDEVRKLKDYLANIGSTVTILSRNIDLGDDGAGNSNIKYKFARFLYADVDKAIKEGQKLDVNFSFEEYYDNLVVNDQNGSAPIGWEEITVKPNPKNIKELMYERGGLLPNTSYLFMLYPYRQLNDGTIVESHYPSYIIVTTEPEGDPAVPDPTVPNLYITDIGQTDITVSWRYNTDFEYEIIYNMEDKIEGAKKVEFKLPSDPNDDKYPKNGEYYELKVGDLYPDTGYYFYIRAIQPKSNKKSLWSNPAFAKTKDVLNPEPPFGIGVASDKIMREHGYETGITNHSIAIEWIKHPKDKESNAVGNREVYSYIIEVADNERFIDPIYIVSGDKDSKKPDQVEILEKNLIKVNQLISNRTYYFRLKTRVAVKGSNGKIIVKESIYYSDVLRVKTSSSSDEYDSYIDPEVEILPEENYELIYDKVKKELIYRFRDNGKDGQGKPDNNVDQRLISQLIRKNIYQYDIDIRKYQDKPVNSRKVIIPYTILEAFQSYKIKLAINTGNIKAEIPYNSLMKEVERMKSQYGVAPTLELSFKQDKAHSDVSAGLLLVNNPENINVTVISPLLIQQLKFADNQVKLNIYTQNRTVVYNKKPVAYVYRDSAYVKLAGGYDQTEGAFVTETKELGTYSVFITEGSNEIKTANPSHWSDRYKRAVDSKYTIEGLSNYNPDAAIKQDQLINIVYKIVKQQDIIQVNEYISNAMLKELVYSGIKSDMIKGGASVSRAEAIKMMSKAINIKKDISSNVLYGDISSRPSSNITYAEVFALWAKGEGLQ